MQYNDFLKKNGLWLMVLAFFLLSVAPWLFIPLIIIILIFHKPILQLINKFKNMEGKTIDYSQLTTKGIKGVRNIVIAVIIIVFVIILLFKMIVIIPAGQTGVYHLFGKVKDKELSSGIHLINPLAEIEKMGIRTEQYTMSIVAQEGEKIGDDSIDALTKEGLKVTLDLSILYHLIENEASNVYKNIGLAYPEKIIRPEVRNAIREVIALYEAKDIYSEKREEAAKKILEMLKNNIEPRGIAIETVLLRNVKLPPLLTTAIEEKLSAEQEAQKYDFVLQKEEKEAKRKRIEAQGQRDAQQIINQSLTNQYLQYLYIRELKDREGTIYVPYDLPLFRGL
ncbi:MAG: prohibitin family protein [Candidatus Buchananbacteria bacterium]|nr:prohibitin family protein [Candidatus Buchananbacteria bacterium]